eukprot:2813802-Rhodomonas_salina.1
MVTCPVRDSIGHVTWGRGTPLEGARGVQREIGGGGHVTSGTSREHVTQPGGHVTQDPTT